MKERVLYWDVCKAIAIFLVIWGHSLQNLTTDNNYWLEDGISQILISFHMPLFMIISGYFAYSSLQKSFALVIRKKVVQLLLPSVVWGIIISSIAMAFHCDFTLSRLLYIAENTIYSYWFLKSLFMCYFLVMLGTYIYRWGRIGAIIVFTIFLLGIGEYLNYASTISMIPFFCFGLLLRRYENMIFNNAKIIVTLSICIYCFCMTTWRSEDYNIYLHPFAWRGEELKCYLIRCLIGISGSVILIFFVRYIHIKNAVSRISAFLADIGTKTLGIYLIQALFAEGVFKMFAIQVDIFMANIPNAINPIVYDFVITLIAACSVLLLSILIIGIIRKSRIGKFCLLGEL